MTRRKGNIDNGETGNTMSSVNLVNAWTVVWQATTCRASHYASSVSPQRKRETRYIDFWFWSGSIFIARARCGQRGHSEESDAMVREAIWQPMVDWLGGRCDAGVVSDIVGVLMAFRRRRDAFWKLRE